MTETNISIARVPQVTVIDPRIPEKAKLRVAAYARVSSDSEDQVNSYIAQVDFYTKHIAGKEDWEMVDIYADEGISGLEARNRDDFNRMMADCREGKIDRVLCKSISRFARNTQEYIQFVRELLRLGISIHFEKENIDTGKMTSEQVAQIYGAFAQMESTNHSSNMRFSVRMRMEKGLFVPSSVPYGYRLAGRDLEIIPEEAEVVRRIFSAYLSGQGKDDIARELNQLGVDIDNEIARISEQNLVLVRLKLKGYVDSALYLSQMDEIDRKLRELRKLRRRLLEAAGEDRQIHDTERMMEYLEDGPEWLDEVPAELFGELIERIIIISPERLKFRLLNGMELAENIERTVR